MIINFIQSFDSRMDLNNTLTFIFSANYVKCQDKEDYWGITAQFLDQDKPVTFYFGNPSADSLNYEGVAVSEVCTSLSAVAGVRDAFYKLFQQANSDVLFLISCNSKNWTQRSFELFKDADVIPPGKEVIFISLQVLHKIQSDEFYAAMVASGTMENLSDDVQFSRSLSLNKMIDIYHPARPTITAANIWRCNATWQIANELMNCMPKNEEEM